MAHCRRPFGLCLCKTDWACVQVAGVALRLRSIAAAIATRLNEQVADTIRLEVDGSTISSRGPDGLTPGTTA
jgi:hypothetical protein